MPVLESSKIRGTLRNIGDHGHSNAPPEMLAFVTEVINIILASFNVSLDSEGVSFAVESEPRARPRGDVLFKPICVTRNGINLEVQVPNTSAENPRRRCVIRFEGISNDRVFGHFTQFVAKNPVTTENWPIIQERGYVPDPIAECWTEERCRSLTFRLVQKTFQTMMRVTGEVLIETLQEIIPPECWPKNTSGWAKHVNHLIAMGWIQSFMILHIRSWRWARFGPGLKGRRLITAKYGGIELGADDEVNNQMLQAAVDNIRAAADLVVENMRRINEEIAPKASAALRRQAAAEQALKVAQKEYDHASSVVDALDADYRVCVNQLMEADAIYREMTPGFRLPPLELRQLLPEE